MKRIELGNNKAIELTQGDLTKESTDAIVNAANNMLSAGGGVCGAIFRAAGPSLGRECDAIMDSRGPLPTGQAVATSAGQMTAKHIIHTVGPVWFGGQQNEPQLLADCHRSSIRVADELRLSSIAFPAISTGIFGYPLELAAPIALASAREALVAAKNVNLVRFVLFDQRALETFERHAESA